MDKKTFVITTDQNSDYEACMSPIFCKYDYIQFKAPESVIVMNGHEKLYDEDALDRARRAGEDAAWNLARKIICSPTNGGYSVATLHDIFGSCLSGDCLRKYTCREAAEKINEWEERQTKALCIGDVLTGPDNSTAVVMGFEHDGKHVYLVNSDGSCGKEATTFAQTYRKKTGRTVDIPVFLNHLRGEE